MTMSYPQELERERRLDAACTGFLKAVDAGQHPDPRDWLERYPDLADELREYFADELHVERLAAPLRRVAHADTPAPGDTPVLGRANAIGGCPVPSHLGDYELLEELGRGGMGIVYRARQKSLNREVALKLLRGDDPDDRPRFRREAELAATLDHPAIVPIYEVGEQDGQCYFSMKRIEGGTLADALRRAPSAFRPAEMARTIAALADAVHHAHQRGVLHRDLKPANILLDANGQPHVTDFGLARRLAREGEAPAEPVTHSGALVGTPSYMAPEQVSGDRTAITTATDVYGLGAILYALLTGRPPHQGATPLDTMLSVREHEPTPLDGPRDLVTICMKALARNPAQRYSSANELAADLRRWLAGEPIQARAVRRIERVWRWCRRNRTVAGLLIGVFTLLISLAVGATGAALRIAAARQREAEARQEAERDFGRALAAVDKYLTRISDSPELKAHGLQSLRRELLLVARQFYQQFIDERGKDPHLRRELVKAYLLLGQIAGDIDTRDEAIHLYQQALTLTEQLADEQPAETVHQEQAVTALLNLGNLYRQTGDLARAEEAYSKAQVIIEGLIQDKPLDVWYLRQAEVLVRLVLLHGDRLDAKMAETRLKKAQNLYRQIGKNQPDNLDCLRGLATACMNLGNLHRLRKPDEALPAYREAQEILESLVQRKLPNPEDKNNLAAAHYNLGNYWWRQREDLEQAAAAYRRGLDLLEELCHEHPRILKYEHALARHYGVLGQVHTLRKRWQDAEAAQRRAAHVLERLVREDPSMLPYHHDLGVTNGSVAETLVRAERFSESLEWFARAIRAFHAALHLNKKDERSRLFLFLMEMGRLQALARMALT